MLIDSYPDPHLDRFLAYTGNLAGQPIGRSRRTIGIRGTQPKHGGCLRALAEKATHELRSVRELLGAIGVQPSPDDLTRLKSF